MKTVVDLLPYIVGCYEAIIRVLPTQGRNHSILHAILSGLVTLSGFLNKERPWKGSGRELPVIAVGILFTLASCAAVKRVDCLSSKTVMITVKTGDSTYYSVKVPYCDTIQYRKKDPVDTLKIQ
jgi:hypothetical protein